MTNVERKFVDLAFQGTSIANQRTAAVTDGLFMNYSATAAFSISRTINPAEDTVGDLALVVATLIHDLNAKKVV